VSVRLATSCTAALLLGSSCAIESSGLGGIDAAGRDAGVDAPATDAPGIDAPGIDAAGIDASRSDGAVADSGGPEDAGPPDAGPPDAGPPDAGPPDCRDMADRCGTPAGYGGGCTAPDQCWPGLECCTHNRCGGGDPIGGTCTITGCGADGSRDGCPLDMICWHDTCLFPCGTGFRCPHADQACAHMEVCEWD
jgi:hypothetical protein